MVLGGTAADKLFPPGENPLGRWVRIKGFPCEVVGLLTRKGQSPTGEDYDDIAVMPWRAYQMRLLGGASPWLQGTIFSCAIAPEAVQPAMAEMRALLRDRHRLAAGAPDDFSLKDLSEVAAAQRKSTEVVTWLLAAVAAMSLLVGGIGVMNTMLVAVVERTREVGLRMAIGARRGDIVAQFLAESAALASVGACVGAALGWFAAARIASALGWPLVVEPMAVGLAVAVSGGCGLVFGLYPALRASGIAPLEALRTE